MFFFFHTLSLTHEYVPAWLITLFSWFICVWLGTDSTGKKDFLISLNIWCILVIYKSPNTYKCTVHFSFCPSACPYPWAKPYQPQSYWHPGVLAASSSKAKSWTCLRLPPVFPYRRWWTGELSRATWKLHAVSASGPATWHHLPAAHWGVHPRGQEPTISLELSPHTQNFQSHR